MSVSFVPLVCNLVFLVQQLKWCPFPYAGHEESHFSGFSYRNDAQDLIVDNILDILVQIS